MTSAPTMDLVLTELPVSNPGEPSPAEPEAAGSLAAILSSVRVAVREEVRTMVSRQGRGALPGPQSASSSAGSLPGTSCAGELAGIGYSL